MASTVITPAAVRKVEPGFTRVVAQRRWTVTVSPRASRATVGCFSSMVTALPVSTFTIRQADS